MTPLDAAALFGLLLLPFHWLVQRQFDLLEDCAYLRSHGVVIVKTSAVECCSESLGRYMGREIPRTVTFKGMVYRFDRVILPRHREHIGARELYLDPGLVYAAV